ncbi:hypothetical protein [Metabacillus iocasae]|uniref:Uncharacterized protein n=1 Tax=Priestia iocasae TaxID=2291674 RepID=A0ABS2QX92_9BACI|nr:hypothetical protein [Metabacillus iocasae]MBM7704030.1 hypothetical protein [Metabacillus iocasae]
MVILALLVIITVISIVIALRKQKPFFFAVPFLSLLIYFVVEIALVPAPFFETVKFIFSLH